MWRRLRVLVLGLSSLLLIGCGSNPVMRLLTVSGQPPGGQVLVRHPPGEAGTNYDLAWSGRFTRNADLSLTAVPPADSTFDRWSGDVPEGHEADNPLLLVTDRDRDLTAHWQAQPQVLARILEVSPDPQVEGNPVHFEGAGEAPAGDPIVAWEWRFSTDGVARQFGDRPEFDCWDFSAGEYDILLRVRSGDGTWSEWAEWEGNPLTITAAG